MTSRFDLGRTIATANTLVALQEAGHTLCEFVVRHSNGDWGDVGPADKVANEQAINTGARLFSKYTLTNGVVMYVITDAADDCGERASTCVLLLENKAPCDTGCFPNLGRLLARMPQDREENIIEQKPMIRLALLLGRAIKGRTRNAQT
jgi:hypothetical protein